MKAEEILLKMVPVFQQDFDNTLKQMVIRVMEEYAKQSNAELIAALEEVLDFLEDDTAGRIMDDKIKRLISKSKAQ